MHTVKSVNISCNVASLSYRNYTIRIHDMAVCNFLCFKILKYIM